MSARNRLKVDRLLVLLYAALALWGVFTIYAAVYDEDHKRLFDLSQEYGKQLLWVGTSAVLASAVLLVDRKIWVNYAPLWYAVAVVLLTAVLFVGKTVGGAKSWFAIGSFSLQPSEISKFTTVLALAYYLSFPRVDIRRWGARLIAVAIIILPTVLIGVQPDLGSALVFLSLLLVLYREGMPGYYFGAVFGIAAIAIMGLLLPISQSLITLGVLFLLVLLLLPKKLKFILGNAAFSALAVGLIFAVDVIMERLLAPHQQVRIKVLLGLQDDPSGAGYNTLQSLIAIGSGGLHGKGYLNGTQTKLNFVPEQSTDYIFCTIGEELGFVGTSLLLLAFSALIARIIFLAEKQKNTFARVYGYGVAIVFFVHFTINIGMTIGLLPTIGIPLPFFSYGGSSLWGFTLLLFIFIKLDAERWNSLS